MDLRLATLIRVTSTNVVKATCGVQVVPASEYDVAELTG